MNRRVLGSGRRLAILGAIVILAGCFLPWWTVGGATGSLPTRSGNAFEASGILVFLAALTTLAIVTLPFAAERPVGVDRWPSYAVLAVVGWLGLLLRIIDLATTDYFSIQAPAEVLSRNPGLWVAAIGLAILSRAVYDMSGERPRR